MHKKQALLELIKQMNKLIADDGGDDSVSLAKTMDDVEEELLDDVDAKPIDDDDEPKDMIADEKKSFMKGLGPKPKGKTLSVVAVDMMKPKKKMMKYG